MPDESKSTMPASPPDPDAPVAFEHPRGTLAIVIIFGVLFGVGWLAMYVLRFLATGAPQGH